MYKLGLYIHLIRVPFCSYQKFHRIQSLLKLGMEQSNFKITKVRVFLENHAQLKNLRL